MGTLETTFEAIVGSEEQAIFIELPFDTKVVFGRARPPVVVTINGYSFRSTPSIYGGKGYIPLRASNREAARVDIGDRVQVTLALDTAPRTVEPPPDLLEALACDPRAAAAWEKLSFSHQREHAEAIESAKKPETRAKRVAKALEMLLAKEA